MTLTSKEKCSIYQNIPITDTQYYCMERSKKKLVIINNILSFDEVNVWIYRFLKKIIFIELEGGSEYNLFSKVNYFE